MKPKVIYLEKDSDIVSLTTNELNKLLDEFYNIGLKEGYSLPKQIDLHNPLAPERIYTAPNTTPYKLPDEFTTTPNFDPYYSGVYSTLTSNF